MSLLLFAKKKFNPIAWFLKGEPGAWYDPSDISINWRRNLLTYSEDFSNGVWPLLQSTIVNTSTLNPNGIAFSQKIIGNTSVNLHGTNLAFTPAIGVYTKSIYAKVAGYNWLLIQIACGGTNVSYSFNLSSGSKGTAYNIVGTSTATITSIGDGWYRCTLTGTAISTTAGNIRYWVQSSDTNGYVSGDGTSGIYIWGAQLEQSSSASEYQKITDGVQDYYTYQPQPVLFQDAAGTIPITYIEQPVGLMLDKSKGLALGAELVTNGGPFTNTTGWVSRANCTLAVVGNELIGTGTTSGSVYRFYYQPVTVIGYTYKVTVNITSLAGTGDLLTVYSSAGAGQIASISIPTTGIYTIYFTATTTTTCVEFGDINSTSPKYTGISNISVKQIAGNHAFQGDSTSTPAKRPMLSARVNLLTKTEDFSDAVWGKGNCSIDPLNYPAPNNVMSAKKIIENNTFSAHSIYTSVTNNTSTTFILSAYMKAGERTFGVLSATGWPVTSIKVNLLTGERVFVGSSVSSAGADPIGNGWFRVYLTISQNINFGVVLAPWDSTPYDNITGYQGNGTSGIYIWHPDLRPTNSGTLLPPYQRVNTASDYDTVGFPLYLKANGTSSAMSTNSIDFTGTDKMTVVTGVRKFSDAEYACVMELSVNSNLNNASFAVFAPGSLSAGNTSISSKGTAIATLNDTSSVPPISKIMTLVASISTPLLTYRLNGTQVGTSSVTQGSGVYGNYPLYLFSRPSTVFFLNGQFYGAIIRGAQSDTASVTQTENYMATKTGITF